MMYQQSRQIEDRLERVLALIASGGYSTPKIAEEVGVSIPTVSRCVNALRNRGHVIRAERDSSAWRYVLVKSQDALTYETKSPRSPLQTSKGVGDA